MDVCDGGICYEFIFNKELSSNLNVSNIHMMKNNQIPR